MTPEEAKSLATHSALGDACLESENGTVWTDFTLARHDGTDFASVDRTTLRVLMEAAFDAGRAYGRKERN